MNQVDKRKRFPGRGNGVAKLWRHEGDSGYFENNNCPLLTINILNNFRISCILLQKSFRASGIPTFIDEDIKVRVG